MAKMENDHKRKERAKELSEQDFKCQFTTPDRWMQFIKPK